MWYTVRGACCIVTCARERQQPHTTDTHELESRAATGDKCSNGQINTMTTRDAANTSMRVTARHTYTLRTHGGRAADLNRVLEGQHRGLLRLQLDAPVDAARGGAPHDAVLLHGAVLAAGQRHAARAHDARRAAHAAQVRLRLLRHLL
jgi:hypothetical protein